MPITPVKYVGLPYVRNGSLGELLQLRGQHEADAIRQRGDISAQLWANIGNQLSQAIQGYAQQKQQEPILRDQAEARRLELQNAREERAARLTATEDKATVASAEGSGLEPEQVREQLRVLNRPDLIPIYDQTHTALETARLGLKAKQTELQGFEADYFGGLAAGVKKAKYDPVAIEWALKQAEADGHDVRQMRQMLQAQPDALPTIIDSLIEKSPTQRKMMGEEADRALKTTQEERALEAAKATAADREADNKRAVETAAETARHNKAMEERPTGTGQERAGYFTMTPVYDAQGRPIGAMKLNARTGETEFVKPDALGGGVTARPPGTLGQQTIANESALDSLSRIKDMFDKGAKDDVGPLEGRARQAGQSVPGGKFVTERFANFDAASTAFKNSVIKAITGAQMSEPEAKRITGQIPLPTDNPTVWKAKYDQTVENLKDLENRTRTDRGSAPAATPNKIGRFDVVVEP